VDISSRACAFIRRYLRAFQFSAKPPLSLVHRSIISSRGTCRLCSMLHLDVDRVPPISHIPSTAANELPSVIGDATFLQIFCHSIPRRLSLNCRTGDAKRSANFGCDLSRPPRFFVRPKGAAFPRRGTGSVPREETSTPSATTRIQPAFLESV
jgi:hypothetical protein